jgi:hypothetical protein
VRTGLLVGALVLAAGGVGIAAWSYSSTSKAPPPRSSSASRGRSTTTTTTTSSTTTTVPVPSSPQPTADAAADALVNDWASDNRMAALAVATPSAVSTLFAVSYPSGDVTNRGCATAFPPATCTIGPPGGANPNLPIYSFTMASVSAGWYVSAVQIEGG